MLFEKVPRIDRGLHVRPQRRRRVGVFEVSGRLVVHKVEPLLRFIRAERPVVRAQFARVIIVVVPVGEAVVRDPLFVAEPDLVLAHARVRGGGEVDAPLGNHARVDAV